MERNKEDYPAEFVEAIGPGYWDEEVALRIADSIQSLLQEMEEDVFGEQIRDLANEYHSDLTCEAEEEFIDRTMTAEDLTRDEVVEKYEEEIGELEADWENCYDQARENFQDGEGLKEYYDHHLRDLRDEIERINEEDAEEEEAELDEDARENWELTVSLEALIGAGACNEGIILAFKELAEPGDDYITITKKNLTILARNLKHMQNNFEYFIDEACFHLPLVVRDSNKTLYQEEGIYHRHPKEGPAKSWGEDRDGEYWYRGINFTEILILLLGTKREDLQEALKEVSYDTLTGILDGLTKEYKMRHSLLFACNHKDRIDYLEKRQSDLLHNLQAQTQIVNRYLKQEEEQEEEEAERDEEEKKEGVEE